MRRTLLSVLAICLAAPLMLAQFGGREDEVVIYTVSVKGNPNPVIVPPTTANTQSGFEGKDPLSLPLEPFGPDFAGECFVTPHSEAAHNCRFIVHRERILTQHNTFVVPAKLMSIHGRDP